MVRIRDIVLRRLGIAIGLDWSKALGIRDGKKLIIETHKNLEEHGITDNIGADCVRTRH
jgi:hypothetical protein